MDSARPDQAMYVIEIRDGDECGAGAFIPESMVEVDAALSCLLHAMCDVVDEQAPDRHYLAGAIVS